MLVQFAYADMAVLNSFAPEMYALPDIFDHNSPNQIVLEKCLKRDHVSVKYR